MRDALFLLLHVYCSTDYADWFGCPTDLMAYQQWRTEGSAGEGDWELGFQEKLGDFDIWMIASPEHDQRWSASLKLMHSLFGAEGVDGSQRFWPAFFCLRNLGLLVQVLCIRTGNVGYPLWIFSESYREALEKAFGPVGNLGKALQRVAERCYLDPDNNIIREAIEADGDGTGIFFCYGASPRPYLVVAPRLHAPTPINLDGITEVATHNAEVTRELSFVGPADDAEVA